MNVLTGILISAFFAVQAQATLIAVAISPNGGALNLGATTYTQDHAIGLAAVNEGGQPASAASGNVTGSGILFDDVTRELTFSFAYGSDFGFNDLGSNFANVHIHGPGPVNFPALNTSAGVAQGIAGFHTAGSSTLTGSVSGAITLTPGQATDLLDNELYINIHSQTFGTGEIRGQLVPVAIIPEAGTTGLLLAGFVTLCALRRRG